MNTIKVENLRQEIIAYIEPAQKENTNTHGFRTIEFNKNFYNSLKEEQIYPIICTAVEDLPQEIKEVFIFDDLTSYKNGESMQDGQLVAVENLPAGTKVVKTGRKRIAHFLAFGAKAQAVKIEMQKDAALNIDKSNEQREISQSSIFAKLLGRINAGDNLDAAIKTLNLAALWSSSTANNQKTSIKLTFSILAALEETHSEKLQSYLLDGLVTYNNVRALFNHIPKSYKETAGLIYKNEAGKTAKDAAKIGLFILNYLSYCGDAISFSKSKVLAYVETQQPQEGDDDDKSTAKAPALNKEIISSINSDEKLQFNVEDVRVLTKVLAKDGNLEDVFNDKTQKYSFSAIIAAMQDDANIAAIKKAKEETTASKNKALFNKLFTVTKTKESEETKVSATFLDFLDNYLNDSERGLLFDAVRF